MANIPKTIKDEKGRFMKGNIPFVRIDQTKLSKKVKDKYSIVSNAFRVAEDKSVGLDRNGKPKDLITVEVGDTKQEQFYPQVKLCRWGDDENTNEVNFSIRLAENEIGTEKVSTKDDKILWEQGNIVIENYPYIDDEGGYKFVWYLKNKPDKNKFNFTIQSKGLDFFYQPPLTAEITQEQKDKGYTATETDIFDENGAPISHRPENVVGSYAVYHSTKGGMNDINGKDYKTGQAFMIYRPHIIDANGVETWGILHIENGIYSVEIPQEFLDKAVYPIKSNDTIGYNTGGASEDYWTVSKISYSYVASGSGTLTNFYAYFRKNDSTTNGDSVKVALYTDSGGSPNAPIAGSNIELTATSTTKNWYNNAISGSITNGNTYWTAITCVYENNHPSYFGYTSVSGSKRAASDYSTFPQNPYGTITSTTDNEKISIYATYTPSGGSSAIKSIAGVSQTSIKSIGGVLITSVKSIAGVSNI